MGRKVLLAVRSNNFAKIDGVIYIVSLILFIERGLPLLDCLEDSFFGQEK